MPKGKSMANFYIINALGQNLANSKSCPMLRLCNLGPKKYAPSWSLVRKENDDLAVQYKDVHVLAYSYVMVHSLPSWLVCDRNQVYFACYSAQTAHKLV